MDNYNSFLIKNEIQSFAGKGQKKRSSGREVTKEEELGILKGEEKRYRGLLTARLLYGH